ncbi:type VI secretion system lipoprotein TssJ [Hafnia paralvei]|jgi:type VI secretion system protein VasD|uniref:type VI secretion system lipoprotein TssJ n=1 Tax=Hafnia paralvei TaxID=546367 RepID=UPI000DF1E3C1|nr:type VI secretion system lipoprotein TssJ [Hafnia paralvei]NIH30652.1 type VI secretion system lipoprotein TssJ [Hafnia paralvei]RDA70793.1 type VI secretion system lipoprotein TssJ [Hafnia paralvei]RDA71635.1 type VI secretion system lipoprotein TssJ [Hafnia paralvei]RDA71739.1 type VI secretion system lipoprotein TssJ [Hafnia paralvei]RDA80737.1 type VI secretion system lipoprotein TssJ [Hafnia paralvei]
MSIFAFKSHSFQAGAVVLSALLLAGCGLTQSVADGTVSVTKSIFYKQIKTLHLDFNAREALNTDANDMSALSVPTMVRVYQLRDSKTFEQLDYQSLLVDGDASLKTDLLSSREVVVKPGTGALLNMPMEKEAKFVAVVGLFRMPDTQKNSWRLVIDREDLLPDDPRVIELGNNALSLKPVKD